MQKTKTVKKTTILVHSKTGLSALIAGLHLSEGGASLAKVSLPRLWRLINKPGQFLIFEGEDLTVICFNSGTAAKYVEQLVKTSTTLWSGQHITCRYAPEGAFSRVRARLFCSSPVLTWLITPELTRGKAVAEWR